MVIMEVFALQVVRKTNNVQKITQKVLLQNLSVNSKNTEMNIIAL